MVIGTYDVLYMSGSYCGLQFILQMAYDVQILRYILLHDTFILQWPGGKSMRGALIKFLFSENLHFVMIHLSL